MEFIKRPGPAQDHGGDSNKPFPIDQVIEWGKAVCDVLTHMHNQSPPLIHRDLKPDNIMLLEDQQSIKMIDFGTARDLGRTAKERGAGKTRVYTEGYAPPEQIVGKPEPRSDLFALAGTLYHLATGKAPEGFYTAQELEDAARRSSSPTIPREPSLVLRADQDQPGGGRQRPLFLREGNQGRPGKEAGDARTRPARSARRRTRCASPYCVKCAEPLTDATALCNQCGKNNRMGSRFCIYCGNRVK